MFRYLVTVIVFLYSVSGFAETIRFAAEATYPPFVSMDKSGVMQGFDVELANALCKEMNAVCTFTHQPWDGLMPGLKMGKFDAIIGGMGITKAREKYVLFTQPYYKGSGSFLAVKGKFPDHAVTTLAKTTIGTQGGTTYPNYLQAIYGDKIIIKSYPTIEDAFLDLQSGRIDLVMGTTPVLKKWLNSHVVANYELVGKPIESEEYFGKGNGIIVAQSNPDLAQRFNQALDKLQANGLYQKLVEQYFGTTA